MYKAFSEADCVFSFCMYQCPHHLCSAPRPPPLLLLPMCIGDDVRSSQTLECQKISLELSRVTFIDIEEESKSMSFRRSKMYTLSPIDDVIMPPICLILLIFV